MNGTEVLEREAVSLIRENLSDAVAAHAIQDPTPGARGWRVSLSTVDGSEYVLRSGLTRDFAARVAVEASRCILALRTGHEYPEGLPRLDVAQLPRHGVTIELREGAVAYPGTDGSPAWQRPTWCADVAARMEALRTMTLKQLAEHKLLPADAWRRLGARQVERPAMVYWRRRGLNEHGHRHPAREWHLVRATEHSTICGKPIPVGETHEVHDSRYSRVRTTQMPACPLCIARRDMGVRG
jgi:hypothetical protein